MTSNGPCSTRRSVHIGERTISTPATSSSERSTNARRKPSRCRCRRERLSSPCWRRTTWAPKSRSARAALRSTHTPRGDRARSRPRTGRASGRAPAAPPATRAGRWWRRRRSAARGAGGGSAISCSTANASSVAVWSFASSATSPRQKSDEIVSVGRKCDAANVLLPEPEAPISTTRHGSGSSIFIARTPPAGSAARRPRPRARPAGSARRSRIARPRRTPRRPNSARVHSKRWSG